MKSGLLMLGTLCGLVLLSGVSTLSAQSTASSKDASTQSTSPSESICRAVVQALRDEQWSEARRLIEQIEDVNVSARGQMPLLHYATHFDRPELVKLLLSRDAGPNLETAYGVTPLAIACMNGNPNVVGQLLEAEANASGISASGEPLIMTAARTGNAEVVSLLIDAGADVNTSIRGKQNAIVWAADAGHADVVRRLIQADCDAGHRLPSGLTPMLLAARNGHQDVVEVLLEAGQDIQQIAEPIRRPAKGPVKGTSALLLAIENGHFDLAMQLIEWGADPNDRRSGFTPLHVLTWVRKPNLGDGPDGDPAPRGTGRLGSLEFARRLIQAGADVNVRLEGGGSIYGIKREGSTPLLLAASTADLPLLRVLLESDANLGLANADGTTPLMVAAGVGTRAPTEEAGTELEVLETLDYLAQVTDGVNAVDRRGDSAMHGAAYKNLPAVVEWLGEHGADPSLWLEPNKQGWSPLQIAEGFRPGNYKPSPETVAAIHAQLRAAGLKIPPPTPRRILDKRKGYDR